MAGNALEILKMSSFCERFVFWNGYVRKENQRHGPSCPKVGGSSPAAPPPERPLNVVFVTVNWILKCFTGRFAV